jgi:hypothetical protein
MSNKTTLPHLVLERFPHIAVAIEIPDNIKGDEEAEHSFLYPVIMRDYRNEWHIICEEVDKGIEAGSVAFNSETGEITLLNN